MAANGSPPPVFETDDDRTSFVIRLPVRATPEATPEVTPELSPKVTGLTEAIDRLLGVLEGEMSRQDLQAALSLKDEKHFRTAFLQPALDARLVAMTQPDNPRSSKQRYRLTDSGIKRRLALKAGP